MVNAREHLVGLKKKWWSRRRECAVVGPDDCNGTLFIRLFALPVRQSARRVSRNIHLALIFRKHAAVKLNSPLIIESHHVLHTDRHVLRLKPWYIASRY